MLIGHKQVNVREGDRIDLPSRGGIQDRQSAPGPSGSHGCAHCLRWNLVLSQHHAHLVDEADCLLDVLGIDLPIGARDDHDPVHSRLVDLDQGSAGRAGSGADLRVIDPLGDHEAPQPLAGIIGAHGRHHHHPRTGTCSGHRLIESLAASEALEGVAEDRLPGSGHPLQPDNQIEICAAHYHDGHRRSIAGATAGSRSQTTSRYRLTVPDTGWLGIDAGTGSVKAAVIDEAGTVISQASIPYPVQAPRPGWAQSDPNDWLSATRQAAQAAIGASGRRIAGIGLSGQMHGVVLADRAGAPIRPAILWADNRSVEQVHGLQQAFDRERLARLGSGAVAGFAATTLAWLHRHEPEALASAHSILQPKDWLRVALGGQLATDPSDASGTLMCDVASGTWDEQAVAWTRAPRAALPPILDSREAAGVISIDGQQAPVVVGGADTACAVGGIGLMPGDAFIAVGTGSQVVSVLGTPEVDPTLATHTFCGLGPAATAWYRIGAVQNAGLALQVALRWLQADVHQAHAALAEGIRLDDPVFISTLSGERTPYMDPSMTGSWDGLRLSTDRPAMLRSVLEGIATGIALAVDAVRSTGAPWPPVVPLVGGGTHDPAFRQLLASATGCALAVIEAPDAAVVGAAMLAMGQVRTPGQPSPIEVIEPDVRQAELLQARRERYRAAIEHMRGA